MPKFLTKEQITSVANQIKTYIDTKFGKAVLFTPQTLADSEKAQARTNINTDKPSELKTITNASIASFADGSSTPVKNLKAALDVVQPLNGYSNPWPAGGGKNKFHFTASRSGYTWSDGCGFADINVDDDSVTITGTATTAHQFSVAGATITLAAGTYRISVSVSNKVLLGIYNSDGTEIITSTSNPTGSPFVLNEQTTVSFAFTILQGATAGKIGIQIEEGSTATDWTPYSNISPIYPHSEVEVTRAGKNLDFKTIAGNVINSTGTIASNASYDVHCAYVKAGQTYIVSNNGSALTGLSYGYYDREPVVNLSALTGRLAAPNGVITATMDAYIAIVALAGSSKVQIELGSTATTYEAYNGTQYLVNIGINQWDEEWENGAYDLDTGAKTAGTAVRNKNNIPCLPSTNYFFQAPSGVSATVFYYKADGTYIGRNSSINGAFTSRAEAYSMNFYLLSYGSTYNNNISINYPSRFTEYYPYTSRQVYGGELDVTTGVLTSRYAFKDLGTATWQRASNGNFFAEDAAPGRVFANCLAYCSNYARFRDTGGAAETILNGTFCFQSNQSVLPRVIIRDDAYTDAATFKTAMAGVQLVYQLASPLTIQLTPTEVQTLTGINNLWADSGAVNVSYWTEGLIEADNLNAVLDSKKVVYASPHTYNTEEAKIARDNIGAGSNRNLLDNPWWGSAEIINQRGATSGSITNGVYNFDRWKGAIGGTGGNFEITANGVALTVTGTYVQYRQLFEDVTRLEGKTLTASVLLSNGTIYSGTLTRVNGTIQTFFNQENAIAVFFQTDNSFRVTAYTNLTIRAVKLELGTVSTLANDGPPEYAKELAKCQFNGILKLNEGYYLAGRAINASAAVFFVPWKHRAGDSGTSYVSGLISTIYHSGGSVTPSTNPAKNSASTDYIRLTVTGLSGLTAGEPVIGEIGTNGLIVSNDL